MITDMLSVTHSHVFENISTPKSLLTILSFPFFFLPRIPLK